MIVVFDTCTQPEYRRDLHRLLALPPGAILRYEYKRKLISADAANRLENFSPLKQPLPTILLYGEHHSYKLGAPDKGLPMLTWKSAVFVPTRSAVIVSVHVERATDPKNDVFHFHLRLKGFVDPARPEIERLINYLEQRNCLPFGDYQTQYIWVTAVEENQQNTIGTSMLVSDHQEPWTEVLNVLCSPQTQFSTDIFWRITALREVRSSRNIEVQLQDRRANRWGQLDYDRDYTVYQRRRYRIEYQTFDPSHHGRVIPGNAAIALVPNDPDGKILVPTQPVTLRPNQNSSASFSIAHSASLGDSFGSIEVVTQVADWTEAKFDPGARCPLTLRITRSKTRLILCLILGLLAVSLAAFAAIKPETHVVLSLVCGALAVLSGGAAYYFFTGKIRESK
jgi:hypothetical protein